MNFKPYIATVRLQLLVGVCLFVWMGLLSIFIGEKSSKCNVSESKRPRSVGSFILEMN